MTLKFALGATILLATGAIVFADSFGLPQTQCTFSDGSSITFGRKALGVSEPGADLWRAGDLQATPFTNSEHVRVGGIEVPPGSYTIFVDSSKQMPWTLIISKKTGEWGIPYPGEQYDLGRARMGEDGLSPRTEDLTIGCMPSSPAHSPIFLWMELGQHAAIAKVLASKVVDGKTVWLWY